MLLCVLAIASNTSTCACLQVLCLNHNHIESIVPRPKPAAQAAPRVRPSGMSLPPELDAYSPEQYAPVLEKLEVLHLAYNGIRDLVALQINRLIGLKALFLQGTYNVALNGEISALNFCRYL